MIAWLLKMTDCKAYGRSWTSHELDAELKKRADRDKELVASVEKQVEDLRSEIDSILKCRAGEKLVASTLTHINDHLLAATQEIFYSSQHVD